MYYYYFPEKKYLKLSTFTITITLLHSLRYGKFCWHFFNNLLMVVQNLYHLNYFIYIITSNFSCFMVIFMYIIKQVSFIELLVLVILNFDLYNTILYLSLYQIFIHNFYIFKLFFLLLLKLLFIGFKMG